MKCLSFNCRGLASPSKKLAMKRLIESELVDIIMLQETLCPAEKIVHDMQAMVPGWCFFANDAVGRSGGIAIGFNTRTIKPNSTWGGMGFIGLDYFSADLGMDLRMVNIYVTCSQRESFWRHTLQLPLLNSEHVIIGGDLNFSLGFGESWGSEAQIDPITGYMTNLLEQYDLVDIPLLRLQPTWRNRRVGEAALARRLDRYLIKGPLLQHLHLFRQWIGSGGNSDHNPIYLECHGPFRKPKAPFKFNPIWLMDQNYTKMIKDFWASHPIHGSAPLAKGFCRNLAEIKHLTIEWAKEKRNRETVQLSQIEVALCSLTDEKGQGFISVDEKCKLIDLEQQKIKILKEREESIRLRSRALWMKAGDDNTKFFHNFAKCRKVSNTIWKLPSPDGDIADNFNKLAHLGISYFRNLYRSPHEENLLDIINVANHFPRFVEGEDMNALTEPVSTAELEGVMKWFKKDKSPGPDGWTIEFYIAFFDVLGQDLLQVVEESRSTGSIYHAINSTFIDLIPKSDTLASFDEYRPISLCNCLYKIISKTIANRLRPILSRSIAPQQFAFLESRQIHEAIGLAQEALHSVWSKHLRAILLKIDLSKAFDRVSWLYLKMILIHLGFPHAFITWIMACITTPSFSILINGSASDFFHSDRGLRQGCPLSPLLFLLVMEGLSRLMESAKRSGEIGGLRISDLCSITHLLFVDDVLILLNGSVRDSRAFAKILHLFSSATGMKPNQIKSSITCARTTVQETQIGLQSFPYEVHPLDRGLKYLGFNLKPTCQRIGDWVWLATKLEKRLSGWSFRYLSRAGRLVLIKSVLEATPVFWMALAWIPRNILGRLQQICNRYLWNGRQDKRLFAWIGWKKISLPKKWGGWGLKDLPEFAKALAAKMGWTLLTRQNLWTQALLLSLPLIRNNLAWRINDGWSGRIGLDPWINSGGRHNLNPDLILHLQSQNIRFFAQIADQQHTDLFSQAWKTAQHLNLPIHWHQEWAQYIEALTDSHIRIKQGPDELIWCIAYHGSYAPKLGYTALIAHRMPDLFQSWWHSIWKLKASPRSKLFFWCALYGNVPTGDHINRRAICGPSWCIFCRDASEALNHIFIHCPVIVNLWNNICNHLRLNVKWEGIDFKEAWENWTTHHLGAKLQNLPPVAGWFIWLARNRAIFDDRAISWYKVETSIISAYQEIPDPPPPRQRTIQPLPHIDRSTPWAFFDGAANQDGCGGGFVLYINDHHRFFVKLGLGIGSNNFAELSVVHGLLHFALSRQIHSITILGDSLVVINWINNITHCHSHTLSNLLHDTLIYKAAYNLCTCLHIYREHNSAADKLSKEATSLPRGEWIISEQNGAEEFQYYHRPFIDQRAQRGNSPI
eukprot:PITA_27180